MARFLLFVFLMFAACHFQPMLAGKQGQQLEGIEIELATPEDLYDQKIGFIFKDYLERFIDTETNKKYVLKLDYEIKQRKYAIQERNTFATRQKAILVLNYKLIDLYTNKLAHQGQITRSDSFNIEDSTYSTHISERKSLETLVYSIVDQLMLQLSAILYPKA